MVQGPILRTIQRFGKLGRRSGKGNENTMKDTKYMFISIDEAGSHVRVKHFRYWTDSWCTLNCSTGESTQQARNDCFEDIHRV